MLRVFKHKRHSVDLLADMYTTMDGEGNVLYKAPGGLDHATIADMPPDHLIACKWNPRPPHLTVV